MYMTWFVCKMLFRHMCAQLLYRFVTIRNNGPLLKIKADTQTLYQLYVC